MTDREGPSVYRSWGAPPQPMPTDEGSRSSWFGAAMIVVVMFGWLVVVFAMETAVAHRDPNVEVPVEVGLGVVVNPADGWYTADDYWGIGGKVVALQHSGVLAFFWAEEHQGTTEEYLVEVIADLQQEYESFSTLPPAGVRVAGDLLGLRVHFSGVAPGQGREEGELAVVTYRGIGVTMWVRAWQGQMAWVQSDLDFMLRNLVVPR